MVALVVVKQIGYIYRPPANAIRPGDPGVSERNARKRTKSVRRKVFNLSAKKLDRFFPHPPYTVRPDSETGSGVVASKRASWPLSIFSPRTLACAAEFDAPT
ncbi:beta (1--_2) glucan biosynthesis protein [Anopheles sinensis]|uniref:Beta (1-->2) glucan biosynthesis protein n=1 Tax=Anopheles sinensis TaxID=74873 RepID=A0A084VDI6_ANOSI|nr:beta (1-->2) glucan biosynthesis protein [Anopheles sinensis]